MEAENSFEVALYMKPFYPSDIHLKSDEDNNLFIIHAKHDEHVDEHGFVKRELTYVYKLPDGISTEKLKFEFTRSGIVTIRAMQDDQTLFTESSEMNIQTMVNIMEEIEHAQSFRIYEGIDIRERNEEMEEKLELSFAELTDKDMQSMRSNLGADMSLNDDIEVPEESKVVHSLQPSSTEEMEIAKESEIVHNQQSNSAEATKVTKEAGVLHHILPRSRRVEAMEEAGSTCSPQPSSTGIMDLNESSETTPHLQTAEILSSEMETSDSAHSPMSCSPEVMEATETAHRSQTPVEIMEVSEDSRSPV